MNIIVNIHSLLKGLECILIYKITNTINGKNYIGQSHKTLEQRVKQYYEDYKYRAKGIRPIIQAMRDYGFEAFEFEVIVDGITTQQELDEMEIYYIRKFDSINNGYNVYEGGNGRTHDELTKIKIGLSQMGNKNHMYGKIGKLNATSKPIIELTTGVVYESACIAAQELNLNFSHICAVARGTRGSTGGYIFRYIDEDGNPIKPTSTTMIKRPAIIERVMEKYVYLL